MFRSPGAVALWYAWLLLALVSLGDLAVQGRDHTSAVIAAVLVLLTGVVYVAALRPRILADDEGITIRNPLRDTRVPWGAVAGIDVTDLVRIHYRVEPAESAPGTAVRQRTVHSWALQSSRRSRLRADLRARSRASTPGPAAGYGRLPEEARALTHQPVAMAAASQLEEWRATAQAGGAVAGRPVVTWSPVALAALLAPGVLVAVVAAVG